MLKSKYVLTGVSVAKSDLKGISKKFRFSFDQSFTKAYETYGLAKKRDDFRITIGKSVGKGVRKPSLGWGGPSGRPGPKAIKDIISGFPKSHLGYSYQCPECTPTAPPVTWIVIQACRMGKASDVIVQCSYGHWATYGCEECSIQVSKLW
jgi:hypothetical protein